MVEKTEKWYEKKKYPRDWNKYNEELVKRGTFYLDLTWVKNWNKELDIMNHNKVGAPFQYPESLIELQSVWLHFVPVREVEGITRRVAEIGKIPNYNDYSTISRRVNKMSTKFDIPKDKNIFVGTDGSGMKMNMSGEYFEEMYGDGKKKFIKVVISADPFNKDIFKIDVTLEGEDESESEIAMNHITELDSEGFNILKFWGDGSYDTHDLFDTLDLYNIESAIKIRDNAVIDPKGSVRRNIEVRKYQELGYEKWAEQKQYGMRWPATEGIFSSVKLKFGERVRSKKINNMIREVKRKFWAYEKIRKYAKE